MASFSTSPASMAASSASASLTRLMCQSRNEAIMGASTWLPLFAFGRRGPAAAASFGWDRKKSRAALTVSLITAGERL